jgi:hypothetical protein
VPCRWYYKLQEAARVQLLRTHIETYQLQIDVADDTIMDIWDWRQLAIYVKSLQALSDASDILEGESYPTASSVIPFLDQVSCSFKTRLTIISHRNGFNSLL